jgi:very-short-patch-repair endonuclease
MTNPSRGSLQARELRQRMTPAEQALWELLRGRRLLGLKFVRKCPISRYVADFCCRELRLVIELDGEVHAEDKQISHDLNRDGYIRSLGYRIIRFPNQQVLGDPGSVLSQISTTIRTSYPWLNL